MTTPAHTGGRGSGPDRRLGSLGRYQLIGRLATGGMAEIYLALTGELSGYRTLVVVKRILPHLASNDQFVRMFLDEARIEAQLDHPNVVRIVEVGHDGDEYFLAMELVQGKPLSTVLRRASRDKTPLLHPLAAYIVAQAANGLGYAHTLVDAEGQPMNIVHRDVSPQNILVSFEGAVKIIDFGIARADGRDTHTNPGGLKGKIQYMSPEQASAADIDQRSDVFALGVVLWEVLVGQRLFYRDNELAMMRAVVEEPIPSPSQLVSTPAELEAIVMRALDRDPARRFHTAQEMGLALERFAFGNGAFSPQQLATYMKLLFASDYLQWKRTVATAMEMEVLPAIRHAVHPADVHHDFPTASSLDPRSSGATVELHRAPSNFHDAENPESSVETPILPAAESFISPSVPSAHDRLWVYGGIASLAMISIAGVLVLSQPRNNPRRVEGPAQTLAVARLEPAAAESDAAPADAWVGTVALGGGVPAPPAAPTMALPASAPVPPSAPTPVLPAASPVAALPPAVTAPSPVSGTGGAVSPPAAVVAMAASPASALPLPLPLGARPLPLPPAPAPAPPASTIATPKAKRANTPSAKEGKAQRARAGKLALSAAARNRRLSVRDIGRPHPPKSNPRIPTLPRTNRYIDDELPPLTLPRRAAESAPAPVDHRRNPFD